MTKATDMDEKAREVAELEGTLPALRAYRKSDPAFERAMADYVDSEAVLEDDPAEGQQESEDIRALRAAKAAERDEPTVSLADVEKDLGL